MTPPTPTQWCAHDATVRALSVDVGVLKARQDRSDSDIRDLIVSQHEEFEKVHARLGNIEATLNRQRGAKSVIGMLFSAIGAAIALAAQWAIGHWK